MLFVAPIQDSLFGFVIVANTAIGIIQEYRAARTLAKLAVLGEARDCLVFIVALSVPPSALMVLMLRRARRR